MSQPTSESSGILIPQSVLGKLHEKSLKNIAMELILAREPLLAWEALSRCEALDSALPDVVQSIRDNHPGMGLSEADASELLLPLATSVMARFAPTAPSIPLGAPNGLNPYSLSFWLQQPPSFLRALLGASGGETLPALSLECFKSEMDRFASLGHLFGLQQWGRFSGALEVMPELWGPFTRECARRANPPHKCSWGVINGTAGLQLAARGHLAHFNECIKALNQAGLDVPASLAQRWPDFDDRDDPMRHAANALTSALVAGNEPIARRIIELNPALSALSEARLIAKRCEEYAQDAVASERAELEALASRALAVSEAVELRRALPAQGAKRSNSIIAPRAL